MKSKTEIQEKTSLDWLKWAFVLILIIAGLIANYYYNTQPWPLRLLGWLLLLVMAFVVALQTQQGGKALEFARESRIELRKVYWPTRQETIQTTFVVATVVIVLALMLWGVDSLLMSLVGWLTGQRG
jgi:preprotein translocase subunit SecE